jgi:hypothetical protein
VWGHEPAHAGGGGGAVEGCSRDALLVEGKSATMMAEFCYFLGVHNLTHKCHTQNENRATPTAAAQPMQQFHDNCHNLSVNLKKFSQIFKKCMEKARSCVCSTAGCGVRPTASFWLGKEVGA